MTRCAHSADSYLPGNGDDRYGVDRYDLAITYRPASNRLDGTARIRATLLADTESLCLDLADLAVDKVTVDGARPRKYAHRKGKLHVAFDRPRRAGDQLALVVRYSGHPRPVRSAWGDVGWEELENGALVAGQPNGAPSWFPCNDRPGDKAPYRITVTTDTPFHVLANGLLVSRRASASTTTWTYDQPEPMATYLASVQIGRYVVRDLDDPGVRQQVARPQRMADAVARGLARQPDMMSCFIDLFGAYPFRSYTVVVTDDALEIPLEAQGMSVFGSNHLDGSGAHERLVAHELAHQWFGNSLTVGRWSDIWLNEGFACYSEWLWSEWSGGPSAHEFAQKYWKRLRDARQDLVLVDPGPKLMFDDRVYKRGAMTLHAVRAALGTDAFVELLHEWCRRGRHGVVDTDGFRALVDGSGELLGRWLTEPGLPDLPPAPAGRLR